MSVRYRSTLAASVAAQFAALTGGDPAAPLLLAAVPLRRGVVELLTACVPPDLRARVPLLHAQHTVRIERAFTGQAGVEVSGRHVRTSTTASGTFYTLLFQLADPDRNSLVEEHEMVVIAPAPRIDRPSRPRVWAQGPPDHYPLLLRIGTDVALSRRYAEVSGDDTDIHIDNAAAGAFGYAGVILHGLCTLALSVNALRAHLPGPVGSFSVRFCRPLASGTELTVAGRPIGGGYGFECADAAGQVGLDRGQVTSSRLFAAVQPAQDP